MQSQTCRSDRVAKELEISINCFKVEAWGRNPRCSKVERMVAAPHLRNCRTYPVVKTWCHSRSWTLWMPLKALRNLLAVKLGRFFWPMQTASSSRKTYQLPAKQCLKKNDSLSPKLNNSQIPERLPTDIYPVLHFQALKLSSMFVTKTRKWTKTLSATRICWLQTWSTLKNTSRTRKLSTILT